VKIKGLNHSPRIPAPLFPRPYIFVIPQSAISPFWYFNPQSQIRNLLAFSLSIRNPQSEIRN
jgi:hypothetical protein